MLSSAKKEKESNEIEIENQTTDYYILTQYAQESDKISKVEGSIPKVDIDLDLLKPYHYENYFDESNKLVEQRTEDSPRNEDSNKF